MNQFTNAPVIEGGNSLTQKWRHAVLALTLLVAWTLFLYRDTGIAMATIWYRSETFTHGFLVLPIVLWLAWRQRDAMTAIMPKPMLGLFVFIVGAAFAWLLGELVAINAVTQLAFVFLLVSTVPAVLGWSITRCIIFPLSFLFFAVPVGEFLMPQLMEWTANFTVLALRLSGIPVYREGLQFVIPSGNWSVVEACSGIRYLIASLTVGTLFAYLNYQSTKRRILFVIVSLLVPVVANWLRAYMIVMLGHLSGNKLAAGVDHLVYGWLFFGVVIMLMFIIGARWSEPEPPGRTRAANASSMNDELDLGVLWTVATCFCILVATPHLALWAVNRSESAATVRPIALVAPAALAKDWQATEPDTRNFKPAFQNPSAEINSSYRVADRKVGLYIGYYRHQNYERKLISSENVLVVSKDPQWAHVTSAVKAIAFNGKPLTVRTAELRGAALTEQSDAARLVVWQIYWVNGMLTTSDYVAKAYSAFYRLIGRGDDSAAIVVYTAKDQPGGADVVLEAFLSANYPTINDLLLKVQQGK